MSMYLFANALSSAIQEACTPSLNDPNLIWPFAATAIAGVILALWFYWLYRGLDNDEYVREGVAEEDDTTALERGDSGDGEVAENEKV